MEQQFDQASVEPRIWDGFLPETARGLDREDLARFTHKRILVTGAGGYLGSALARVLARLPIASLILLDQNEFGLYRLDQDFRKLDSRPPTSLIVGSILNRALLDEVFMQQDPQLVFHAAALKHVSLMEANPFAAAEINILGTQTLLEAALHATASRLVFVSTDKAVEPTSIMGATKRIAEQILLQAHQHSPERFAALRLCNVLGSTGSVAPLFARQLAAGQPLTVTHAAATRFFLSTVDAVRCLLRAAILPSHTGLLAPPVERSYYVQDLAHFLLQRSGQRTDRIVYTGLSKGEKLHEQLFSPSESIQPTTDRSLLAVHSSFHKDRLAAAVDAIRIAVASRDAAKLLDAIRSTVPAYSSQGAGTEQHNRAIA